MKKQTWLAMFGVVSALAGIGIVSANSFSSPLAVVASHDAMVANPLGMIGHITITVYDKAGNVIEYRQTDNTIVNIGENCVAEAMFNVTSAGAGADECTGVGVNTGGNGFADGGFRFIQIGNGTAGVDDSAEDDTGLTNAYTAGTMGVQEDPTPSYTPSTGVGVSSSAIVTVSGDFTALSDGSIVNESGLFDSAAPGNMLARQGFANVTLNSGDTLTVEWQITIGG
jgi:hypothetical protein